MAVVTAAWDRQEQGAARRAVNRVSVRQKTDVVPPPAVLDVRMPAPLIVRTPPHQMGARIVRIAVAPAAMTLRPLLLMDAVPVHLHVLQCVRVPVPQAVRVVPQPVREYVRILASGIAKHPVLEHVRSIVDIRPNESAQQ